MSSPLFVVTGGAGFIGHHVARGLLESGQRVRVVDNLSMGRRELVPDGAEFDGPSNCGLLKPDDIECGATIVHLACHPRCNASLFAPVSDLELSYLPGIRLLTAALNAGIRRFVLVSSMSVYGDAPCPYHEGATPLPRDPYAVHKRALEMVVEQLCRAHQVEYTVLRPQHVYGPGQRSDLTYRNVVARWARLMLEGKPLPVFGSLDLRRAFSPLTLVARGIVAAALLPAGANQTFNLGTRKVRSLRHIAAWIARELGIRYPAFETRPAPPTLLEAGHGLVDKAGNHLGVEEDPNEADACLHGLLRELVTMPLGLEERGFEPEVLHEQHALVYQAARRPANGIRSPPALFGSNVGLTSWSL